MKRSDIPKMTKEQTEKIEFWKKNPDVFVEEFYNIKLFPYQKQFIRLINKTPLYLLLYPRRKFFMIDRKYRREDLIGKKCRPVRDIQNGGGDGISPTTICTIVDVVRGHGFKVTTEKCPCCGQYTYMTGVSRNDLELIEEQ